MGLEFVGDWFGAKARGQVAKILFARTVRTGYGIHLRVREQCKLGALEFKHPVAAGRTVVEVRLHPRFCLRSRTGGPLSVLLNLSIAQMLRSLVHCTRLSLI